MVVVMLFVLIVARISDECMTVQDEDELGDRDTRGTGRATAKHGCTCTRQVVSMCIINILWAHARYEIMGQTDSDHLPNN